MTGTVSASRHPTQALSSTERVRRIDRLAILAARVVPPFVGLARRTRHQRSRHVLRGVRDRLRQITFLGLAPPSDWLFPTLLVTSGLSLSFLFREAPRRATCRRLIRRLVLLIAVGLVYNSCGASWLDLSPLRFTGVLQMIGIAGADAAVAVLASRSILGEEKIWWLLLMATGIIGLHGLSASAGGADDGVGHTHCLSHLRRVVDTHDVDARADGGRDGCGGTEQTIIGLGVGDCADGRLA